MFYLYLLSTGVGAASFLSPCIIPMITVYLSTITGLSIEKLQGNINPKKLRKEILISTFFFVLAFTIIFSLAGRVAAQAGAFLQGYMSIFNILGGLFIILFSLNLLGIFKFHIKMPFSHQEMGEKAKTKYKYLTAFLIGIFFAIACSHCIAPTLYSLLIYAGTVGSANVGMIMMLFFSIGLAIPYFIVAIGYNKALKSIKNISKYIKPVQKVMGILMLGLGILILSGRFTLIVELFYKFIPFNIPLGM